MQAQTHAPRRLQRRAHERSCGPPAEKGGERAVLEIMELWARDLMRVQNGAAPLDAQEAQRLRASSYCGSALLQRVMRARRQLNANVPWVNVLESMEFELAREKA